MPWRRVPCCLLVAATLMLAITGVATAPARAAGGPQFGDIGQYGEVWRGGGFDQAAYDAGRYDKPLTKGEFLDPVGFAVDPQDKTAGGDGTAVYVLDRTSDLPGNVTGGATSWRLQKLDDQGNVVGADHFTLPVDVNNDEMLSLTVDPAEGRVYALVVAYDPDNFGVLPNGPAECVVEILSWSTTPNGQGQLVAATGLSPDTLSSGAGGDPAPGVLSTAAQMIPGGNPQGGSIPQVTAPQGVALDVVGATRYLAIEGADDNRSDIKSGNIAATGIAQVCTITTCGSAASGGVTRQWSANALAGLPNDVAESVFPPAGISTAADGSLTVLLDEQSGQGPSNLDVIDVPANLTSTPTIASSTGNAVENPDLASAAIDDSAVMANDVPPNLGDPDGFTPSTFTASAQVIGLSNGLFAGVFEPGIPGQSDPQNPSGGAALWTPADPGLRLLAPESDQTLSNLAPPLTSLFDTLGNAAANTTGHVDPASACSLLDGVTASAGDGGNPAPSLAAGAKGSIWILTRGMDSSGGQGAASEGGRELIELAPGGAGDPCPTPSETFALATDGGAPSPASTSKPLPVKVGGTVAFDASTITYLGAATEEYQWDFGDGTSDTVFGSSDPPFTWPGTADSHQYKNPGTYTVTLKLFGDFGEYDQSGVLDVGSGTLPVAAFSVAATADPMTVGFDASASTPSPGKALISYDWNWGDGQIDQTAGPTDSHTYGAPGAYTVRLTVLDSSYAHSAATTQIITAAARPPAPPVQTPPPSAPPPPPPPVVSASFASRVSRGRLSLRVSCPPVQTSCAGTIRLKTARAVTVDARHRGRMRHPRQRVLMLGTVSFSVAGGQDAPVVLRISRHALSLLGAVRRVRVIATIATTNPQGATSSSSYKLRLGLPAGASHRGKHRKR